MTISAETCTFRRMMALLAVLSSVLMCRGQIVLTPSTGCAPLAVQFTGPAGATNVLWNLAAGTTTLSSPSNIYQAGTYNIFYTALVGGNPVSYSTTLVVSNPPSGSMSFVLPTSHCLPMTVTLTGNGGSPGSTYSWSYGDLTSLGTGASVTHVYASKGSFVPVMTVIDAVTGCTAVATNQSGTVNVSAPPLLFITANPGFSACSPTHAAAFSGSTSASGSPFPGPLSGWTWTISGGTPSSAAGITTGLINFGQGQHTVYVSATDNNQCSGSTEAVLSVQATTLTLQNYTVYCLGSSDTIDFISSEPVSWWTEPGGTPTMVTSAPSLTFSTPGMNIFTVTINPPFPCPVLTKTFSAFVEYIQPIIVTSQPTTSCNGSLVVTYTGMAFSNTTSVLTYTWKPDGGSTYNTASPSVVIGNPATFTINQHVSNNPYTIYRPWFPRIKMYVLSNSLGECDSETNYDNTAVVQRPTAWFYTNKRDGCGPLSVQFRDSSFTYLPTYPIAGFTLHTGVPTVSVSGTGTMSPFTYVYNAPGTYSAWMIVRTSTLTNCIDTSFFHDIHVGQPPAASLALTSSVVCAGTAVQFSLSATPPSTMAPHWHVATDRNFYSHCITDANPSWPFTHTGTHGFTVSAYDSGCEGASVSTSSITVKGPYAGLRVKGTCTQGQRSTVVISSMLDEVSTATLFFGDNSSVSITGNATGIVSHSVSHTYSASGDYVATLLTENNVSGCNPRTFTVPVIIRDAQARITFSNSLLPALPSSIGCNKKSYTFSGITSTDVMATCERGYIWSLTHPSYTYQPSDDDSPVYTPTVLQYAGVYTLVLKVKDLNGCEDTNTVRFRLSGGSAEFSITANPLCLSTGTVQFLNTSLDSLSSFDQIVTSKWNFGDGGFYIPADPLENPVHLYQYATNPFITFSVSLITINNYGCSDTLNGSIQVNNPFPDLQVSNDHPCIPKGGIRTITVTGAQGYPTYSINPGIPGAGWLIQTTNTLSVTYYTPGVFATSLVVVDAGNCRAEQVVTVTAVGQPTAVMILEGNTNKFCLPGTPTLISISKNYDTPITNTLWTIGQVTTPPPGTGTFVNHIFTSTGLFTVSLTVNYDGYCSSTTHTNIIVADPKAKLKINKTKFCLGDTIQVSLTDTSVVEGWRWFFGDFKPQPDIYANSVFAKMYPVLSYPYTIFPSDSAGKALLSLQYFGTQGSCPRTETVNLTVIELHTSFGELDNVYRHCLMRVDQFTASTTDHWNLAVNYYWNFGDGQTGINAPIQHRYGYPGTYSIMMTARDSAFGCRDTAFRSMTVLPLPTGTITVNPGEICPGDSAIVTGKGIPGVSGSLTGTVYPEGSVTFNAANEFTLGVTAFQNTSYVLEVTDENQCVSQLVSAPLKVIDPHIQKFWDTTIVIGQTVMLNAYTGSDFTYTWTPVIADLNCVNCYSPVSTSTNDITYTVQITDHPLQCYTLPSVFTIKIKPLATLDVPTAFTPNGDGLNDFIFPDGWGLKRLLYFRIYNRWGQLLYEGKDLKPGWDGTFMGVAQNSETYAYQVAAETLLNTTLTKTGTFKLLR